MPRRRLFSMPRAPAVKAEARPRRRWLVAALGALALAGTAAGPAFPAAADTGAIHFLSASGDGSGDLAVTVSSDNPLLSIKVHLWSGGSDVGTDVLDPADFTAQGGFVADSPQTWVLNSPSSDLATLTPGTYTATADATDLDGDQVISDQPLSGSFSFLAQPVVAFSRPSFTTTAPNQPVSITGQLSCSTLSCYSASTWPQLPVTITDANNTTWPPPPGPPASTGPSGSFSVQVNGIPNDTYTASVAATSTTLPAQSAGTQDLPVFASTSISATTTPAPYGQQTITGTLGYQSAQSLNLLPAPANVKITASAAGQQSVATTTLSNGTFTLTLPPVIGTTVWDLTSEAMDLASTPFLAGAEQPLSGTQLWPAAISGFHASLARTHYLTVGGCLATTLPPGPNPPDRPIVVIQYRTTPTGQWHDLGTVGTQPFAGCAGVGFLGQGFAPAASAYYRATFSGDLTYGPATSASSGRIWLYATQFNPFSATPNTIQAGKKITVSGTLQTYNGKWRAYANQRVLLIYSTNWYVKRPKVPTWYGFAWIKTNSKGQFSKTFTDPVRSAAWSANYDGNSLHLDVSAPERVIRVNRPVHKNQLVALGATRPFQIVLRLAEPTGRASFAWPFVLEDQPLLILMGRQT